METVIEIYREILDNGAEELEQYAKVCAEEFRLQGAYSTIRYGNSPRLQVLRMF